MISVATIALGVLTLAAPTHDPLTILQNLRTFDRQLVKLETELSGLHTQEDQLQEELAELQVQLSETGIRQDKVTRALKKRVRALEQMPGGARMLALGHTDSLQDYLAVSRMLRWVAKHDQKLRREYQEESTQTQALRSKTEERIKILAEISADIKAHRESLGTQRRERLDATERLLSTPSHMQALSGAHLDAYERLQKTFRKLEPGARFSQRFSQNRNQLPWPVIAPVETGFGVVRELVENTRLTHYGMRFKPASGTPIQSVFSGTVVYADWLDGYGQLVIVDHGEGYHSLYGHLGRVEVSKGQSISTGTSLGSAGDTGSWSGTVLYFEIRSRGEAQDPMLWLRH